jgi:hypothetical protein
MVLRDNIMTIYMDGDIYSVTTTADLLVNSNDVRPIVNSTNGDAFIGSTKFSTLGFISKLSMYNYGLTQNQIRNLYNQGPVTKSLLSMFGIANYGVRSPIYNLSDVEGSGEQSTK